MINALSSSFISCITSNFLEVRQNRFIAAEFAYEERAYRKVAQQPIGLESAFALDFVGTSEGFFSFTENRYIYQYRDHLGNARVSYAKKTDGTVEITDTNDYYAFGLNHIGGVNKGYLGSYYNYKYNGKELQETGMYDYGWRQYMPDVGRWMQLDPLVEDTEDPYAYVYNNPISLTDPDGRAPEDSVEDCCSNLKGFALSMMDNVTGGNLTQKYDDGSAEYSNGVRTGNTTSFVAGGLLMLTGANDIGARGTGLVASGVVSSTGVGSIAGGPGALVSGGLILTGTVKMGLGGVMLYNSSQNLKNTKHTDNRHVDRAKYPEKSKYQNLHKKKSFSREQLKTPTK